MSTTGYSTIALASFDGDNGANPSANLVEDANGNLYGTAEQNGAFGYGTVFELTASQVAKGEANPGSGTIIPLVSFHGGDGAYPDADLLLDSSGKYLFGTTPGGGTYGNGTVFKVILDDFSRDGVQGAISGTPSVDPVTGNPTVAIQTNVQAQADEFLTLFDPSQSTPLTPPSWATATNPIDIVATFGAGISFDDLSDKINSLVIPTGIRLRINGGTWYGHSPALTLASGDLTISGATFVNATDAPTILVAGGHLTLRNDVIQESSRFNQAAIRITSGAVDLGMPVDPGNNTIIVYGPGVAVANTTGNTMPQFGDTITEVKADATFSLAGYNVLFDGNSHTATGTATGVVGENLSGMLSFIGTTHKDPGLYIDPVYFAGNSFYNCATLNVTDMITLPSDLSVNTQSALNTNKSGAINATVQAITAADLATLKALATGGYAFRFVFTDASATVTVAATIVSGSSNTGNSFVLTYPNPGPGSPLNALVTSSNTSASAAASVTFDVQVNIDGSWFDLGSDVVKAFLSKK
jgi:hypothetical protein